MAELRELYQEVILEQQQGSAQLSAAAHGKLLRRRIQPALWRSLQGISRRRG